MARKHAIPERRALAAQAFQKPLDALRELIPAVRQAHDIEAVHKMRVASRRLRNAFDLFFDELPPQIRLAELLLYRPGRAGVGQDGVKDHG